MGSKGAPFHVSSLRCVLSRLRRERQEQVVAAINGDGKSNVSPVHRGPLDVATLTALIEDLARIH